MKRRKKALAKEGKTGGKGQRRKGGKKRPTGGGDDMGEIKERRMFRQKKEKERERKGKRRKGGKKGLTGVMTWEKKPWQMNEKGKERTTEGGKKRLRGRK